MTLIQLPRCAALLSLLAAAMHGASPSISAMPAANVTSLPVPGSGQSGFTLLDPSGTGITFTNHLADRSAAENQIRLNGSGVALGDVDGDGRCDIYLCRLEGSNILYRNLGHWKFEDITASAGVACAEQYSTGAVLADIDDDRDLDLLVNSIGGGTRCFFNDGRGRFTENNSGLLRKYCGTSMALADIDGNGTLDLYVANYRTTTIRSTGLQVLNINGKRVLRPEDRESYEITPEGMILEHAEPDLVYTNDGKGNFTAVPWTDGRFRDGNGKPIQRGDRDWGLSVMMRDLNGDRAPDIYVCNDFWSPDAIWINDGKGNFRALSPLALRVTSTFSMGVDVADINRDGFDDLFVVDMRSRDHARRMSQRSMLGGVPSLPRMEERLQTERNTLFLNRGDGTYAEVAQYAGLHSSEWSWSPLFIDVDLDGYEDVLITTGHAFDSQDSDTEERLARGPRIKLSEQILQYPRLAVPNQAFRNRGDLTFEPAGKTWRFDQMGISHGSALADLDGDGDIDVVVNNMNAAAGVYRNDSAAPRIAVRLKGAAPNTSGVGARIEVTGGPVKQGQEVIAGGRYLSSDDPIRTFAAGSVTNRLTVRITWRSGAITTVSNLLPNSLVQVAEADTSLPPIVSPTPKSKPLFRDITDALTQHGEPAPTHVDEAFDDFAQQPLLPKRLSHYGPGIAWTDLDGDGWDDLVIGAGRGGQLTVLRNLGQQEFISISNSPLPKAESDLTGVVSVGRGSGTVLAGVASYEGVATNLNGVAGFQILSNSSQARVAALSASGLPPGISSTGPLALGDIDADGDLDLFIGGQVNPGRYPEPATSRLYRNEAGTFVLAQEWPAVGLVNSAIFTDLTGDGFPELALALEWSPPRFFRNQQGRFTELDMGVAEQRGWWTGITAGDFNGDGRMDLAIGNWGRNALFSNDNECGSRSAECGLSIYYGDFTGAGRADGVLAYYEHGRELPWMDLDRMSLAIPWLRGKFTSYARYGAATLGDVLGETLSSATRLQTTSFDSAVFLNRGDRLERRPLPIEAQLSPVFGIVAGDFNGDGAQDLFLAQNFSPTDGDTSRYDAGLGVLLTGTGRGEFRAMRASESGLSIYGDGRGAAACDFDHDGRLDLAVGQNRGTTRLFRNESATPGLRVTLAGPRSNPAAIGALVRRGDGTRLGPAHELRAGNGWWSQDSATVLLGGSGTNIVIRWPGGHETVSGVPPSARAILINEMGEVTPEK